MTSQTKGGARQLGIPSVVDRLIRQNEDKRVLTLIRRYLEAGTMSGGLVSRRHEGTPQGGPLSPLLSNILLNELDRELDRRGHRFVRYADDANIYLRSQRAGTRVMAHVERFLNQRLKLTLNREKSHVTRPWGCDYLGYGMSWHQQPRLRVATMSLGRLRNRLRDLLRGARGAGPKDGECHRTDKPCVARVGRLLQTQSEQTST